MNLLYGPKDMLERNYGTYFKYFRLNFILADLLIWFLLSLFSFLIGLLVFTAFFDLFLHEILSKVNFTFNGYLSPFIKPLVFSNFELSSIFLTNSQSHWFPGYHSDFEIVRFYSINLLCQLLIQFRIQSRSKVLPIVFSYSRNYVFINV